MNQLLSYLDRIQGRLLAAFGLLFLGTVVIWYVGLTTLRRVTDDMGDRIDSMQRSSSTTLRLQSAILDQIANGEHYLIAQNRETQLAFDSLGAEIQRLAQE